MFFGQSLLFTRSIHLLKMSDSRLIQAALSMNSPSGCSVFPSVLCRQHPFQGLISYWSFKRSVKLNWHFLGLKITGIIHLLNKSPSKSLNGLWSCTADVIRQTSLFWLGHLNICIVQMLLFQSWEDANKIFSYVVLKNKCFLDYFYLKIRDACWVQSCKMNWKSSDHLVREEFDNKGLCTDFFWEAAYLSKSQFDLYLYSCLWETTET